METNLDNHNATHSSVDEFISSYEAALLTGYTSDYISRLCRTGQVIGKKFGHAWFVKKDSVLTFFQGIEVKKQEYFQTLSETRKSEYKNIAPEENIERNADRNIERHTVAISFPITEIIRALYSKTALLLLLGLLLSLSSLLATMDVGSGSRVGVAVASASIAVVDSSVEALGTMWRGVVAIAGRIYNDVATALIRYSNRVGMGEKGGTDEMPVTQKQKVTRQALVVVPAVGTTTNQDEIEKVKRSFSDEVVVEPSGDGSTGMIRPIFKSQKDQAYMYVMVPVDGSP